MKMPEDKLLKNIVGEVFLEIANGIKTEQFGKKARIGLTTFGSEHGIETFVQGAKLATYDENRFEVILIGQKIDADFEIVETTAQEMHSKMEELLDTKYIDACVTVNYGFPIGVSSVGRAITPSFGKEMYIATTTGTASMHRVEAMVKNALHGLIVAKTMGIQEPSIGILNLDGARQVERALRELDQNGYPIHFAKSIRSDSGAIMRGNDLLEGTADVVITDTLTGNIMMKFFSAFTTGGRYETIGYGYGPGVGEGFGRTILIVSSASGAPVIANAIRYAAEMVRNKLADVAKVEFAKAKDAKLDQILEDVTEGRRRSRSLESISAPPKEAVNGAISGIDIMELEDAVKLLWKEGIYAESGMGCTGPIILIREEKIDKAMQILIDENYISR